MGFEVVVVPPLVVPPVAPLPPPVEVEVVVVRAVPEPVERVRVPLTPVSVTEPVVVVMGVVTVVELLLSVARTVLALVEVLAVPAAVVLAEKATHRAVPAEATLPISVAGQALRTQGAAMEAMGAWAVPHWQPTSLAAQPADTTAELMHAVAQVGMPERFWARAPAAAARMRTVFIFDELVGLWWWWKQRAKR